MVYLKVTDGLETRKFHVTPGELTYDQLKEQLGEKFPSIGKDLSFLYRDTDGDIITLSSDEELQSVLTQLPADSVWKLQIKGGKRQPQNQHRQRHTRQSSRGVSLFDSLFDQLWNPSEFSLWHNFDEQLRETEELLQQVRSRACCGKACPQPEASKKQPTTEKKKTTPDAENETTPKTEADGTDHEEVKSKKTDKEAPAEKEPEWQWVVRSWQPRLVVSPFGLSTVLRPTTHRVYWSHSSSEKEDEEKTTETKEKPSEEATTTPAGGASEPQTQTEDVSPQNTEPKATEQ